MMLELVVLPLIIQCKKKKGGGREEGKDLKCFFYFISVIFSASFHLFVWSKSPQLNKNKKKIKDEYVKRNSDLPMNSSTWLIMLFLF